MRRGSLSLILAAGLLLSACGSASGVLYNWGGSALNDPTTKYERYAYRSAARQTDKSTCEMLLMYEELVSRPGGSRQVPPPGICAEYAWLLAQPETAAVFARQATSKQKEAYPFTDYTAGFLARSRELFEQEMRYYPESVVFLKPLTERLFK